MKNRSAQEQGSFTRQPPVPCCNVGLRVASLGAEGQAPLCSLQGPWLTLRQGPAPEQGPAPNQPHTEAQLLALRQNPALRPSSGLGAKPCLRSNPSSKAQLPSLRPHPVAQALSPNPTLRPGPKAQSHMEAQLPP